MGGENRNRVGSQRFSPALILPRARFRLEMATRQRPVLLLTAAISLWLCAPDFRDRTSGRAQQKEHGRLTVLF